MTRHNAPYNAIANISEADADEIVAALRAVGIVCWVTARDYFTGRLGSRTYGVHIHENPAMPGVIRY